MKSIWTPAMQATAEVAAACGVSINQIKQVLGVSRPTVQKYLVMGVAESYRNSSRCWKQANRESHCEHNRRWRQNNPEAQRRYCQANHEARREYDRRWRQNNSEAKREYDRRWRQNNSEAKREYDRQRKARKRAANLVAPIPLTLTTKQHIFALWDCCCAYCNTSGATTVDHVVPLIHGGLDEPNNVVPACRSCNSSKYTSPMEKWYKRQSFFCEARLSKIHHHTSRIPQEL